jgi:hypothetical protein
MCIHHLYLHTWKYIVQSYFLRPVVIKGCMSAASKACQQLVKQVSPVVLLATYRNQMMYADIYIYIYVYIYLCMYIYTYIQ